MTYDTYQKGQVLVYEEDHARLKVEVLENLSSPERIGYKFRVKEVLQRHPNPRIQQLKPEDEFECSKMRDGGFYIGDWNLEELHQELEARVKE